MSFYASFAIDDPLEVFYDKSIYSDKKKSELKTNEDVRDMFTRDFQKKYGVANIKDYSPVVRSRIVRQLVRETVAALGDPNSARGWYTEKMAKALDLLSEAITGLKNETNRKLFCAILAITSNGLTPEANLLIAVQVFLQYMATGDLTMESGTAGGDRSSTMVRSFDRFKVLVSSLGIPDTLRLLLTEDEVSNWKKTLGSFGINASPGFSSDTVVPFSVVVFGPKIGIFFANLSGLHNYLTMDRWWSRTFNRYRGTLVPALIGLKDNPTKSNGELLGVARFKHLYGADDISDEEAINLVETEAKIYRNANFKNPDEVKKAANTIYKLRHGLRDMPTGALDRKFMLECAQQAVKILKRRGVDLTVDDMQAILWYSEKDLYAKLLGKKPASRTSYKEAAETLIKRLGEGSTIEELIAGRDKAIAKAKALREAKASATASGVPFNQGVWEAAYDKRNNTQGLDAERSIQALDEAIEAAKDAEEAGDENQEYEDDFTPPVEDE